MYLQCTHALFFIFYNITYIIVFYMYILQKWIIIHRYYTDIYTEDIIKRKIILKLLYIKTKVAVCSKMDPFISIYILIMNKQNKFNTSVAWKTKLTENGRCKKDIISVRMYFIGVLRCYKTWTIISVEKNMWWFYKFLKISWTERIKNEKLLDWIKEKRKLMQNI